MKYFASDEPELSAGALVTFSCFQRLRSQLFLVLKALRLVLLFRLRRRPP
jgi:hypothetical protein